MENNIVYDCRWSDAVDEKFITDFNFVQDNVFAGEHTEAQFLHQYINNPYGQSVIAVVYIDGKPSAARALWRNDIYGKAAYQPGRTAVLAVCRGKGIFTEMTKRSIAMLPKEAIIYNFPNNNSYPGYIKMGWTLLHDYSLRILCSYKAFHKEHPIKIDNEYARWWIKGRDLFYTKRGGHYFIMHKFNKPLCYRILGEVDKEVAQWFPHVTCGLFFYKSKKITWYNKRFGKSHVVTRNPEIGYIPTWKIDAV